MDSCQASGVRLTTCVHVTTLESAQPESAQLESAQLESGLLWEVSVTRGI